MEKRSRGLTKVVGAALIFLTLVSTAVVVAKNCHVEQIPVAGAVGTVAHVSHGDHVHTPPANPGKVPINSQGVLNSGLISDICTGIFYLVLFLGGRLLFKSRSNFIKDKIEGFKSSLAINKPKVVLNLTLSLPQLGICRI